MSGAIRAAARDFFAAWRFLTRLPAPGWAAAPRRMAEALPYVPAVGAVIGAAGAAVLLGAAQALPMPVAVLLSIGATCALTGALHEDGLADTIDGIGGGRDRDRALAIMRDSRIGTYGALALGLVVAVKATALVAMPAGLAAAALVAGHAASRLSAVLVIATSGYVRETGTARFAADGLAPGGLALAAATGVLCLGVVAALGGVAAALAAAAGLAAGHLLARGIFERRIGGYTGDCLGATQQISEAALYLGIVAWL